MWEPADMDLGFVVQSTSNRTDEGSLELLGLSVDAHPTLQLRRAVERPQDGVVALVGSTDSPPFEAEAGRAGDSALTTRGRYTQLVA